MLKKIRHSRAGFTLVELVIGMTIFSLSITAIFLLLNSTMKSVNYSRSEIIVSNLLREQMELVRNVRDSNIKSGGGWDVAKINDGVKLVQNFQAWFYTIENDFTSIKKEFGGQNGEISASPVNISTISISDKDDFSQKKLKEKFNATQLCFDNQRRYTHVCSETNEKTSFASYIHLEPMWYEEENGNRTRIEIETGKDESGQPIMKTQWFIVDARVIVRDGDNYREYDAKTAITDWNR